MDTHNAQSIVNNEHTQGSVSWTMSTRNVRYTNNVRLSQIVNDDEKRKSSVFDRNGVEIMHLRHIMGNSCAHIAYAQLNSSGLALTMRAQLSSCDLQFQFDVSLSSFKVVKVALKLV